MFSVNITASTIKYLNTGQSIQIIKSTIIDNWCKESCVVQSAGLV